MAKLYITQPFGGNSGETALPRARISYAKSLYEGKADDKGTVKYSPTLIFPKSDIKLLQQKVAEVVVGEWGEKGKERFRTGMIKNPIIDGAGKEARNKSTGELNPGMGEDVVFIRPWSKNPIPVFGPDARPMDPKSIMSGWWGYPVLTGFAWHNEKSGDGVGFWISMWMHSKEDEVIGGGGMPDPGAFLQAEKVSTSGGGDVSGGAADLFDM
jgi:hypothetical protein